MQECSTGGSAWEGPRLGRKGDHGPLGLQTSGARTVVNGGGMTDNSAVTDDKYKVESGVTDSNASSDDDSRWS